MLQPKNVVATALWKTDLRMVSLFQKHVLLFCITITFFYFFNGWYIKGNTNKAANTSGRPIHWSGSSANIQNFNRTTYGKVIFCAFPRGNMVDVLWLFWIDKHKQTLPWIVVHNWNVKMQILKNWAVSILFKSIEATDGSTQQCNKSQIGRLLGHKQCDHKDIILSN